MTAKHFLVTSVLFLIHGEACLPAQGEGQQRISEATVTITPRQTEEILANPGMGWETFHRSNRQDRNLPPWIPSTIYYIRWGWGELEPQPGQIAYTRVNRVLKEAHDSGQRLAFRVMCCSTTRDEPYHPGWLKGVGGHELLAEYEGATFPIADLDDPTTLRRHLDFIQRLGERYDGHPDLDHVDLGSIGWWGEWHLSGSERNRLPAPENRTRVIDAYLAAFRKTPLLMLIGGGPCLKYATGRGAGWRADCLGDMGGFSKNWSHMRDLYPAAIKEGGIRETWKSAPVAWESCWDMRKWVEEGWPLRHIFNSALALHASSFNNKSAPLPSGDAVRPELERFLRRLGYRLVLRELKHPADSGPGARLDLLMKWQNIGSAPCYRPYRLAYRLSDDRGYTAVFVSEITVNRWLPGSVETFTEEFFRMPQDLPPGEIAAVSDSITLPGDIPAGVLTLSLAIVEEHGPRPVVRLGIEGRAGDGWYPLGRVRISR